MVLPQSDITLPAADVPCKMKFILGYQKARKEPPPIGIKA
jgi:hypothetical protein